MRFVEASGASTVFIATGDARLSFSKCELDKTYTVDVQGRCVRMCNGSSKYGVHSQYEVHMQYAPKNLRLATDVVRMSPSYDFTSWADLNAVSLESVVNLIGKVTSEPLRRDASGLPKAVFTLASGDFIQEVTLLGIHATATNLRVGDTIVLAGLLMKEWNGERTREKTWLTAMEVNPSVQHGLPAIETTDASGRKRKAMRMSVRS